VLLNLADISGDRRHMTANAKTLGRGRTISPNRSKSSSAKSNCRWYWKSWTATRFFVSSKQNGLWPWPAAFDSLACSPDP